MDVDAHATELLSRSSAVAAAADALRTALAIHGPASDPRFCRACSVDPADVPWPCGTVRQAAEELERLLR